MNISESIQQKINLLQDDLSKNDQYIKYAETYTYLMNLGLWGPCAVASYVNSFDKKYMTSGVGFEPFNLTEKVGMLYDHYYNSMYLELYLQANPGSFILLWAYTIYSHDLFVKLAKKYEKQNPQRYEYVNETIIRVKLEKCKNASIEEISKFGELLNYFTREYWRGGTDITAKFKIYEKTVYERELLLRSISDSKLWFRGIKPEIRDDPSDVYDFNDIVDPSEYEYTALSRTFQESTTNEKQQSKSINISETMTIRKLPQPKVQEKQSNSAQATMTIRRPPQQTSQASNNNRRPKTQIVTTPKKTNQNQGQQSSTLVIQKVYKSPLITETENKPAKTTTEENKTRPNTTPRIEISQPKSKSSPISIKIQRPPQKQLQIQTPQSQNPPQPKSPLVFTFGKK
ncbi:hypothetical protein TVAG_119580 [Trichomonas vaginalis G3]|uniref:Uncharacterized protein n=1 Tax=Trichomonas vaginalis (strain ATCC PRA-98 / G3) TaxID=412133 RepID=A2D7A4_TRIV3|nr:hypothetical protein TVAGG3_0992370 [Trichomonas vaginalis G3]EAY23621.1 hypothetical protein TVAG_119580 [Trichomonas vaginalis G3]KAI5490113.1 hypothetical protein TVAGG3_0992370 [Trichomonas vaginalis G3]|eukprot:XP_001276869.1 hypothetical protein [Trichomonas vaginalis G3]